MWELWRQDDLGHTFLVSTYATEAEAEESRQSYEAKRHHQHYWVKEVPGKSD